MFWKRKAKKISDAEVRESFEMHTLDELLKIQVFFENELKNIEEDEPAVQRKRDAWLHEEWSKLYQDTLHDYQILQEVISMKRTNKSES